MNDARFQAYVKHMFKKETAPKVGNYVQGDEWVGSNKLNESSDFDKEYFGADVFRVTMGGAMKYEMAMKVKVTGRKCHYTRFTDKHGYTVKKVRVMLTVPGDGEPDTSFGGWMFFDQS